MGTQDGVNGTPTLAARYSSAFAAYLSDRGESALGAAYDLGREAVAEHLSVLDIAEAHHSALRAALGEGWSAAPEGTLQAAADFLRESLSTFETSIAATTRSRRSRASSTSTSSSCARWPTLRWPSTPR